MGRFQAWTLESRARYALVWGAINVAILASISLTVRFPELYVGRALAVVFWGLPLSVSVQGLIGYPRAKRKLSSPQT